MPRFVILLHETPAGYHRPTHFDLMLECGDVLLTWAVAKLPAKETSPTAERLADHRLPYLDYQGPVSGDRGTVRRVDAGEFDWIEHTPKRIQTQMRGIQLRGRLTIEHDGEGQRWRISLSD